MMVSYNVMVSTLDSADGERLYPHRKFCNVALPYRNSRAPESQAWGRVGGGGGKQTGGEESEGLGRGKKA